MYKVRPFIQSDTEQCLRIFDENCPPFFDETERSDFEHWLNCQGDAAQHAYTFTNKGTYVVVENETGELLGSGGYYMDIDQTEARFAWGMIKRELQQKGIGTFLALHRIEAIKNAFPQAEITLATSQHTYPFYAQLGFEVLDIIPSGFAPKLDKYEMKLKWN
ncbi:MAG: GNAT family N-acetyltransferase [Flavobacteriales bacterium]